MAVTPRWSEAASALVTLLRLPQGSDSTGAGRRRLGALVAALPLPAMGLAVAVLVAAAVLFPAELGRAIGLLAAMPEGLWWALVTLIGAVFGLRVQMQEQAFLSDLATPVPPPVGEADPATDAGLSLALAGAAAGDNPALAAWQAASPLAQTPP